MVTVLLLGCNRSNYCGQSAAILISLALAQQQIEAVFMLCDVLHAEVEADLRCKADHPLMTLWLH